MARRPRALDALLDALDGVDRLVLLGDVVELRDSPTAEALRAARPVFEALGERLGDRPVVLVAGNHDHRLVGAWLEARRHGGAPAPLGLEERVPVSEASAGAGAIARWLRPAAAEVAYPGMWLRPDVYATHGHYLDRHVTVPALEPLAIRACERLLARRGRGLHGVDGYEAVAGPVYALLHELAQSPHPPASGDSAAVGFSQRAYRTLTASDGRRRGLRQRLVADVAFPAAVAALNAGGLGPVSRDLSASELRRAGLRAMGEVVRRLGVHAGHVVFGHTHRTGPLAHDDADQWSTPEE